MGPTTIDRSRDAVARRLADSHYDVEPGITEIYRLVSPSSEDEAEEPVKLLEVNESTTSAGIVPVGFGPDAASGIYYCATIVEVTPAEMEQIRNGSLPLPHGWELGERYSSQLRT